MSWRMDRPQCSSFYFESLPILYIQLSLVRCVFVYYGLWVDLEYVSLPTYMVVMPMRKHNFGYGDIFVLEDFLYG